MSPLLRPAHKTEYPALSELCLRSKAHWGYDEHFMEACRTELAVTPSDTLIVAERDGRPIGVAQVEKEGHEASIALLFVDPPAMGHGVGRHLFDWCAATATDMNASKLLIEADPEAEPFYLRMGARRVGEAPSHSIPGRLLPLLEYALKSPEAPDQRRGTVPAPDHP